MAGPDSSLKYDCNRGLSSLAVDQQGGAGNEQAQWQYAKEEYPQSHYAGIGTVYMVIDTFTLRVHRELSITEPVEETCNESEVVVFRSPSAQLYGTQEIRIGSNDDLLRFVVHGP